MTIAVIPVRSKSVSVKDKNIRLLNGRPLLSYAIEAAKKAKRITRIIVSTDSEKYAEIAKQYGAEVLFLRPEHLAEDVPTELVLQHAINWIVEHEEYFTEIYNPNNFVCLLQCTTPLMTPEDIDACLEKIYKSFYDSVITVTECSERPEWMFYSGRVGFVDYLIPFTKEVTGASGVRQFLPKLYRPNGAVYVTKLSTLFLENRIIGKNCGYIIMPKLRSIDIDSEEDFKLLEAIIRSGLVER